MDAGDFCVKRGRKLNKTLMRSMDGQNVGIEFVRKGESERM